MLETLVKGLILGFSIAAPVGPIGVLCIRRTLAEGRLAGLVSGLGAASADFLYGCVAAFGLTAISSLLVDQQTVLRLVGGAFLIYLGVRTFLAPAGQQAASAQGGGLWANYGSTFFLTLTNPMTILSFAAMFAGMGLAGQENGAGGAAWLVAGVFVGSALWWLLLSQGIGLFRRGISASGLVWINRGSGIIITVFGLAALLSLLAG